jgi:hypothetical protein
MVKKYLQKLRFWPSGGKPGPAASRPNRGPNDHDLDSEGKQTPEALDEEQAGAARRQDVNEHFRAVAEQDDSPRSDSDV